MRHMNKYSLFTLLLLTSFSSLATSGWLDENLGLDLRPSGGAGAAATADLAASIRQGKRNPRFSNIVVNMRDGIEKNALPTFSICSWDFDTDAEDALSQLASFKGMVAENAKITFLVPGFFVGSTKRAEALAKKVMSTLGLSQAQLIGESDVLCEECNAGALLCSLNTLFLSFARAHTGMQVDVNGDTLEISHLLYWSPRHFLDRSVWPRV